MKLINLEKLVSHLNYKIHSIENCPLQIAQLGEEMKTEGELEAYKNILFYVVHFMKNVDISWAEEDERNKKYLQEMLVHDRSLSHDNYLRLNTWLIELNTRLNLYNLRKND